MAINIPRSQISQAAAQRRTLLPASEAGAALRGFGRLFEQGAKLAGGMLNKQLQQEHKLWAEESKIKFEGLEDQYLQTLNAIGTEEDLGDMDREASIWGAWHDHVDALESAGLEAAAQLSPRSQRRIQKELTNTTRIMRENPGSALRESNNTVELAQLDFSNQRALNNYSGIPKEGVGSRAALDIARANDMVRRRVITSDRLSQVLTTTLNGARAAYFSEGYQGRIDFALQIFGDPGSGGLSDLPESVKKRERVNILENRDRYIDATDILTPKWGAYVQEPQSQVGQIAGHFPMISGAIAYEPPKRDWQSVDAFQQLLHVNGYTHEANKLLAETAVARKHQARIDNAGVDAANVIEGFIAPGFTHLSVLNNIVSSPEALDDAISQAPATVFRGLMRDTEQATKVFTAINNHFGGLLPEFSKQLNNLMAEDDLNAWEVASHLLGRGIDSPNAIATLQIGDKPFTFADEVIQDIVAYNAFRAVDHPPISALSATRTDIDEKLLSEPTGTNERTTLRSKPEYIFNYLKNNPATQGYDTNQLNVLANNVAAYQEPALRRVAGDSGLSGLSHSRKKDLVIDMAAKQFLNRYEPIDFNDQKLAWQVRLPANQRQNSRGEGAPTRAWMVDSLVDLLMESKENFRDKSFSQMTRETIVKDVIPFISVVPYNDDDEMRDDSGISKYKVMINNPDGEVGDTGYFKNSLGYNLIFQPDYRSSMVGMMSEYPTYLGVTEEIAPEDRDTRAEVTAIAAQQIVSGGIPDKYFNPGTFGGFAERVFDTTAEYLGNQAGGIGHELVTSAELIGMAFLTLGLEEGATFESTRQAMLAHAKKREEDYAAIDRDMENTIGFQSGEWFESWASSKILQSPKYRDRFFNELLPSVVRDFSPQITTDEEVDVPLIGRTKVRPRIQRVWKRLRKLARGDISVEPGRAEGADYDLPGGRDSFTGEAIPPQTPTDLKGDDEYYAMITQIAFEMLEKEVQLDIQDDTRAFMDMYESDIAGPRLESYYFTPDTLRSRVENEAHLALRWTPPPLPPVAAEDADMGLGQPSAGALRFANREGAVVVPKGFKGSGFGEGPLIPEEVVDITKEAAAVVSGKDVVVSGKTGWDRTIENLSDLKRVPGAAVDMYVSVIKALIWDIPQRISTEMPSQPVGSSPVLDAGVKLAGGAAQLMEATVKFPVNFYTKTTEAFPSQPVGSSPVLDVVGGAVGAVAEPMGRGVKFGASMMYDVGNGYIDLLGETLKVPYQMYMNHMGGREEMARVMKNFNLAIEVHGKGTPPTVLTGRAQFTNMGVRFLPSLALDNQDYLQNPAYGGGSEVVISIRPPTQQEQMFNSLIEEGTGSLYWYLPQQNPKAVQITNKWEKENASVGNLMPRTGKAYIPPGYTTDVEAVQQVWNIDPKKSAQTVSDFFYPVLGTSGKEKLYGKFGAIPGVAAEDRKPGWIKRYYTAQSKSLSETFGTDPFMEAKGLQAGIATIMPGKGAAVIMGLTLDQFFTVLEAGVNRYEFERGSE